MSCKFCSSSKFCSSVCRTLETFAMIGGKTKRDREEGEEDEFDSLSVLKTLNALVIDLIDLFLMRMSPARLQEIVYTARLHGQVFARFLGIWERLGQGFARRYIAKWTEEMVVEFDFSMIPEWTIVMMNDMSREKLTLLTRNRWKTLRHLIEKEAKYIFHLGEMMEAGVSGSIFRKHVWDFAWLIKHGISDDALLAYVQQDLDRDRYTETFSNESFQLLFNNANLYPKTVALITKTFPKRVFELGLASWTGQGREIFDVNLENVPERLILDAVQNFNQNELAMFVNHVTDKQGWVETMSVNVALAIIRRIFDNNWELDVNNFLMQTISVIANVDTPYLQVIRSWNADIFKRMSMKMARLLGPRVIHDRRTQVFLPEDEACVEFFKHIPESVLNEIYQFVHSNEYTVPEQRFVATAIYADQVLDGAWINNSRDVSIVVAQAIVRTNNERLFQRLIKQGEKQFTIAACRDDNAIWLQKVYNIFPDMVVNVMICFEDRQTPALNALEVIFKNAQRATLKSNQYTFIVHVICDAWLTQGLTIRACHHIVRGIVRLCGKVKDVYLTHNVGYDTGELYFDLWMHCIDLSTPESKVDLLKSVLSQRNLTDEQKLAISKKIV